MRRGRAMRTTRRRTRRRVRRRHRRRRRRRILIGGAILLGGGALIYKLTRQDTERIEEHTGQSAEDLSDQELQQAMRDLNIQSQDLTDEDRAALGQDEGDAGSETSYLDELERLGQLRDQGIITDDEFEAKKKELLGL
jgi:hypothetical protein